MKGSHWVCEGGEFTISSVYQLACFIPGNNPKDADFLKAIRDNLNNFKFAPHETTKAVDQLDNCVRATVTYAQPASATH